MCPLHAASAHQSNGARAVVVVGRLVVVAMGEQAYRFDRTERGPVVDHDRFAYSGSIFGFRF